VSAFLIAAVFAQACVAPKRPPATKVVCNTGYTVEACLAHRNELVEVLTRFDTASLGEWTWVLVKSEDWKPILRRVSRDPDSPAFTILEKRQTFLEETLFAANPDRSRTLLSKWRVPLDKLLEYATAHELGHMLCHEITEQGAHRYQNQLLSVGKVQCREPASTSRPEHLAHVS
jgi:hypothetical protein